MTCRYDYLYYGGFIFNGFVTTSINTENVRAEDGFTIKYFKHTLECEFIVTNQTKYIGPVEGNTIRSIDADMDYIRQVLMKPHQSFNLGYRGSGRGGIEDQWDSEFVQSFLSASTVKGLSNFGMGPYPEVLFWEPLANNTAARCRWRCVFYTSKANIPVITQSSMSELSETRPKIAAEVQAGDDWLWKLSVLSVVEEQEIDINESGYLVATIKGVIEFSGEETVSQLADWSQTSDDLSVDDMEFWVKNPRCRKSVQQALAQYFEPYQPLGFTRKQRYVFNKENRKLEYVITDTETPNPTAKFPRIVEFTASHEVSSSLFNEDVFSGSGFMTWDTLFQGSFTVAPGYWMGWAWVAMLVIVKQRINRSIPIIGDAAQVVKDDLDAVKTIPQQNGANVAAKVLAPKHLMTSVRVKENIHNRRVDISLRYLVLSNLKNLFKNTGLFTTVHSMFSNDNSSGGGSGVAYDYAEGGTPFHPRDFGKTPVGNPRVWSPLNKERLLRYQNYYLKRMSQNAVGYSGLGLPDYNLVFDPDHQNLPTKSYDANLNPDVTETKTISYTQNPNPYNNDQTPNIYAANRRDVHWLEHPTYKDAYRGEGDYTDSNQPTESAPGASRNPQSGVQYPGASTGGDANMSTFIPFSDKSQTWVEYVTEFELIEKSNSTYLQTVDNINPIKVKGIDVNNAANRAYDSFTINGQLNSAGTSSNPANPTPYTDGHVFSHGKPVYFIRFTGYAIRAGYQIPMPVVHGLVNTKIASGALSLDVYRVGTQYWKQKQLNKSCDIPLFHAEWDMLYAIKGDPTCGSIGFNHTRASEYS